MNVYFLLDRSGSMMSRWSDVTGSIQAYVNTLRETTPREEHSRTKVFLMAFDQDGVASGPRWINGAIGIQNNTQNGFRNDFYVVADKPLTMWNSSEMSGIFPRGGTPLYDAVGRLATKINSDNPQRAVVIIVTDGEENSSREMSLAGVQSIINSWKTREYQVLFFGADFNASYDARSFGLDATSTVSTSAFNLGATMRSAATKSAAYGMTGQTVAYSDVEKKDLGDITS